MDLPQHFTVKYAGWDSMLEEVGDDVVFFRFWVNDTRNGFSAFPVNMSFSFLKQYLQEKDPELHQYISKVRSAIGGWGYKESQVLAELEEGGFDLQALAWQCICHHTDWEKETQRWQEIAYQRADPEQERKLQQAAKSLKKAATAGAQHGPRLDRFCENVEALLLAEVQKSFPEIFESDPDLIREVGSKLFNAVFQLRQDVDGIAFRARKARQQEE